MAENKELLGGLYAQDQYEVTGDPETVSLGLKEFCNWFVSLIITFNKLLYVKLLVLTFSLAKPWLHLQKYPIERQG